MGEKVDSWKSCNKSWEEEVYWQRFSPLAFCMLLRDADDYCRKIALPKKFSEKMKGKIPDVVTLQGPTGLRFNVKISRSTNVLYMTDGWEEFVKSYSFGVNDILFCSYDGYSNIKVIIIEGESQCENELAYFIGMCGHLRSKSHHIKQTRISTEINDCEVHMKHENHDEEDDNIRNKSISREDVLTKKAKDNTVCASPDFEKLHSGLGSYDKSLHHDEPSNNNDEPSSRTKLQYSSPEENDYCLVESPLIPPSVLAASLGSRSRSLRSFQLATNCEDFSVKVGGGGSGRRQTRGSPNLCNSEERVITKAEKDAAMAMGRRNVDALSFCTAMNSTRFSWKSTLMIPGAWFVMNMPRRNQEVILTVGEKRWRTNLEYNGVKGSSLLVDGWDRFVVENELQEFDVCLFKLVSRSAPAVFEVTIIRVIQVGTPQGVAVALESSLPSSSQGA